MNPLQTQNNQPNNTNIKSSETSETQADNNTATKKSTGSSNILEIQNQKENVSKERVVNSLEKQILDNLSLELQRSIDFYQSQLGQAAPTKLLLDPVFNRSAKLIENIKIQVNLPIESLNVNQLTGVSQVIDPLYHLDSLAVIGSAMASLLISTEKKK